MVWDIFQGARSDVSFHNFREIAERNRSFEAVAVMWPWHPAMTGSTQPFLLDGQRVSSNISTRSAFTLPWAAISP